MIVNSIYVEYRTDQPDIVEFRQCDYIFRRNYPTIDPVGDGLSVRNIELLAVAFHGQPFAETVLRSILLEKSLRLVNDLIRLTDEIIDLLSFSHLLKKLLEKI